MTYNQKEKIKSLIKNDKTENILRRIIRNDNFPKYNISRRYITSNNDKNQSLLTKIPFYSIKKKHFPNTTKNSSIQIKQKDKLISESLNSNKLSTSSSISQLNNNLRQLKNYSSLNDITSNCQYNNHSIFISGQTKTPNGNYHIKIGTDKNNKITKTIPKNLNQNFQFHPSTSTALYKRRGERNEERKLNSNILYSSLNSISNIHTNDFNNYRLNSITCKASNNHKISYNFSNNLSNNNYDYVYDSKTFHSHSKYSYGIRRNEVNKSQNENKEKLTFNPKNLLKDENLICERLKKNINMDKKFKILSINNSSKVSNFFFNPLKYQKSLKKEISSNTLKKNNSSEKIKIGFNRSLLQKSDSNHAFKIINESKNKINTSKLITRKDRKEYKFDITERFKKEIHININKDKIKKLNNKMNNNKNNVNNNTNIDNNINNNKFISYNNTNFKRNNSNNSNNNIISNNYTNTNTSTKNIYNNSNINNININNNNINNNNININISNNIQFKSIQIFSKNKNPNKDRINTLLINRNNKAKIVIIKKDLKEKNDKEEKEKIKNINEIIKKEIKLYNQKKNGNDKDNNIDNVSNKENDKNNDLKEKNEDIKKEDEYENKEINNDDNNESKEEGRISQDLGIKDDFDIEEDEEDDKDNIEEKQNNDNGVIENKINIEKEEIKEKEIQDEIINDIKSNRNDEANKEEKYIDNNNEEYKNKDIIIEKNEFENKKLDLEMQINEDIGGNSKKEEKENNQKIEIKEKNNEIKKLSKQKENISKIKKKLNHNLSKKLKIKHQNIIKKHKTNFIIDNQKKKALKIDVSNQNNDEVIFLPLENQIKADTKGQEQKGMVFDYISYSNLYEDESKGLNDNIIYQNTYENKPTSTNTNTNNYNQFDNCVTNNKKRKIPITLKLSGDNSLNDVLNDIKIDEEYKPYVSKYPEKIFKKRGKAYKLKEKDEDKKNSISNVKNKKILSLNTNKIDNNNNLLKYSSYFGDYNNNVYFEIKQFTTKNKSNSNVNIKNKFEMEKKLINSTRNSLKKASFSFFGVQSEALFIPKEN